MKKLFFITTILLLICLFLLTVLPKEEQKENKDSINTNNYEYNNIDTDIDLYNNMSNLYYIKNIHLNDFIKNNKTFTIVVISDNKESKKLTDKLNSILKDSEFYAYIIDKKEMKSSITKTPTLIFYIDGEEVLKTTKVDNIKKLLKEYGYLE